MILTAGMAWTQADADLIRGAIRDLALGKRVVTIAYAGPPARSISYGVADLNQLRELLAEAQIDVASASGRANYRVAATRKGL